MVLVLAVHTVKEVTAKVSFSTILLQDLVTNKKTPTEHKCRQLVPTSGAVSTSLWDTSDPEALLAWLEGAVSVDVTHSVQEVQEEFAIGLGDVARARGTEAVAAGAREVADSAGKAVQDLDAKLRISEKAGRAAEAMRDSAVGRHTAAAFSKAGNTMADATHKVMENERVVAATDAMGASFKRLGSSLKNLVRTPTATAPAADPEPETQPPPLAPQP